MTYPTAAAPVKPVRRTPVAIARCTAILAASISLSLALAVALPPQASAQDQTSTPPPPKPRRSRKPKPIPPTAQEHPAEPAAPTQPAMPNQPGQRPQGGQQNVQLIYSPWTKFCLKGQENNGKQVCLTGKDARIESGMPVVAAVLIEPEGMDRKILRVTLPLGMQLVHGTRVIIDQNQPMTAPYVICVTNGCMADYEANADMVSKLKKGQNLVVQAINSTGQPISLVLPLSDFAKAYEGPPTDPKVFEAEQRKLQEELQRRADEARKKLESEKGAPTSSAAPPGKTQ